jgi:putative NADH-flavin reductase
MRVIVFGATGGTGKEVISQGLEAGYTLTAFVHSRRNSPAEHAHLQIVQGDALNLQAVADAIEGQDAVVSALGVKTSVALHDPNATISTATGNIIKSMQQHQVQRLVFVSSFGVSENVFLPEKLLLHTGLKNLFKDIPAQEALIHDSGLDWTIVRPARLTFGPRTGKYKAGEHITINPFSHISRSDVADYITQSLSNPATIHQTPTLSY